MMESYDAIVLGGGPAGSTAGNLLARRGRRVLVLEKERFPRHHIGESLLPGLTPLYRRLGVARDLERAGFFVKTGGTYVWGRSRRPWSVAFVNGEDRLAPGEVVRAYHVERDRFDALLLDRCAARGAAVRQRSAVTDVAFQGGRIRHVAYRDGDGAIRRAQAAFYIDASGQAALLAARLGRRVYDPQLRNMAVYTYFEGARLLRGAARRTIFICSGADSWVWHIPLSGGRVSVGVVSSVAEAACAQGDPRAYFEAKIRAAPEAAALLSGARIVEPMRVLRDWSYRCDSFVGENFLLAGDAAAFIDPLLSYGVTLAMQSAAMAADCVERALGGRARAGDVLERYQRLHAERFDQLLEFVKYFYDANRDRRAYFWKARRLVAPEGNRYARHAFSYLISGHPFWRDMRRDRYFLRFFRALRAPLSLGRAGEEADLARAAGDVGVLDLFARPDGGGR